MAVKFAPRTQELLRQAAREARGMGHSCLASEHLLLALCAASETVPGRILNWSGASYPVVRRELAESWGQGPVRPLIQGMSPGARELLGAAAGEMTRLGREAMEPEHWLLALGRCPGTGAAALLERCGVSLDTVFTDAVTCVQRQNQQQGGSVTRVLDQFGIDLIEKAERMDTVIGREQQIESVIQILCRKQKHNPALIGQPGVGKTAIVEGLAQRMALGRVPEPLRGKRLISVDVAGMVAGTKYRGEFEERLRDMLREIQRVGNIILFVDEMHTLVGAGAAEGAIDAANILKPALGRGELQLIGATTLEEYRKHIEKDAALERRFRRVQVEPTSHGETMAILQGLRPGLEQHHRLRITPEALEAAVNMAERFLPEHYFPDKAVDLVDEGAAIAALEASRQGGRRQRAALDRELDSALSQRRLDQAMRLQQQLRQLDQAAVCDQVTARHIALAVSDRTGIPAGQLQEPERQRLQDLEGLLARQIIGQDAALHQIAAAVRRGRAGLADPDRPVAAILLMGPTGVGKTALCKALARIVYGSPMIRLDMSEYMEKHAVSRLVGAPPGYVGYEEGGDLTEKVRRHPYSLVLLDELEKAHRDVTGILLQIMEDGVLTDSSGRTVDFRHTLLVMTSNLGSDQTGKGGLGFCPAGEKDRRRAKLSELYPPEFLGRIDCIAQFELLGQRELTRIAGSMLGQLRERAAVQQVRLQIDPALPAQLARRCVGAPEGARSLRHLIQQQVEDPAAQLILGCPVRPLMLTVREQAGEIRVLQS